jgi:hypothetical protein
MGALFCQHWLHDITRFLRQRTGCIVLRWIRARFAPLGVVRSPTLRPITCSRLTDRRVWPRLLGQSPFKMSCRPKVFHRATYSGSLLAAYASLHRIFVGHDEQRQQCSQGSTTLCVRQVRQLR